MKCPRRLVGLNTWSQARDTVGRGYGSFGMKKAARAGPQFWAQLSVSRLWHVRNLCGL